MQERHSRQSFLGPCSEEALLQAYAAIAGLGGGGSHIAQQLAHVGVGNFLLLDDDHAEESNLNRLVGATYDDVVNETPKVDIARRLILGINPRANVLCFKSKWQEKAELLREVDVVFGCVDTLAGRRDLESAARRYLIPYIDIGMDVHRIADFHSISGQVVLSMPGRPCLRCMGILSETALASEASRYGSAGGKPQVVWPNGVLASTAVGIFMRLMSPWCDHHEETIYLEHEGDTGLVAASHRLSVIKDMKCEHYSGDSDIGDPFWSPELSCPSSTGEEA